MNAQSRIPRPHRADLAMSIIVLVWGFNFIVMKDSLDEVPVLVFTALRFAVGAPVMVVFVLRDRALRQISGRDLLVLAGLMLVFSVVYQVLILAGLQRTTSTNSALLASTIPVWTALFSLVAGLVALRGRMMLGIGLTWTGVVLVIISRREGGFSLSGDDLLGSAMVLGAAMLVAASALLSKPLIDRLGAVRFAVWSYFFTAAGLAVLAVPELVSKGDTIDWVGNTPHILYSGMLASAGGFLAWHYALGELGPSRASTYHNFTPVVAALAGIMVLGEPVTLGLVIGGPLALFGVMIVRRNTCLRPPGARCWRRREA